MAQRILTAPPAWTYQNAWMDMNTCHLTDEHLVSCPYCGEGFAAVIDCSAGSQDYIEDCPVCCRGISFAVEVDAEQNLSGLRLLRDDE
jgi:hypothetical protein